jgi:hypothetical protein
MAGVRTGEVGMRHGRYARYGLCVLLAMWLGAVSAAAQAAEPIIGTVLAVRGEVFRDNGGNRALLAAKTPLYAADVIVSGAGKAKIGLNDGTVICVGENTRVHIAEYQSVSNGLKTRLDLNWGVLRLLVNRSGGGGQFEVESETAVAAVRGTDWLIEVTPERTSVAILQGTVAVAGRGASATAVVLLAKSGQGTDVRRGEPPTAVATWGTERFAATVARASFE